jgi:hypothetical protein
VVVVVEEWVNYSQLPYPSTYGGIVEWLYMLRKDVRVSRIDSDSLPYPSLPCQLWASRLVKHMF